MIEKGRDKNDKRNNEEKWTLKEKLKSWQFLLKNRLTESIWNQQSFRQLLCTKLSKKYLSLISQKDAFTFDY